MIVGDGMNTSYLSAEGSPVDKTQTTPRFGVSAGR